MAARLRSLAVRVDRCSDRLVGTCGPVPTPAELWQHAMRHLAAISLVALSAVVVHKTGHTDQQWQYAAMAVGLLPQVLIDLDAVRAPQRRARLRTFKRPTPVPFMATCVLGIGTPILFLSGIATGMGEAAAAGIAVVGLGLAAAPMTIRLAPRAGRLQMDRPRRDPAVRPEEEVASGRR